MLLSVAIKITLSLTIYIQQHFTLHLVTENKKRIQKDSLLIKNETIKCFKSF